MTTEQKMRDALRRSTEVLDPALDVALARLGTARARQRRRRMVVTSVLAAAAAVAAIVVLPSLIGTDGPRPPSRPASVTVGSLQPGTYAVSNGFTRRMELTLDGGWTGATAAAGDVRLQPPSSPTAVVGLARVQRVYEPARSGARVRAAPYDLPSWVKGHPDLTVVASRGIRVGDLVGTRIVVRVAGVPRVPGACPASCSAIFDLTGGPLTAPSGGWVTFVIVNDAGEFLTTYVVSEAGDREAAADALDEVLGTLVFGTAGDDGA